MNDINTNWISFYNESAYKLLEYKNDRKTLLDLIYKNIDSQYISYLHEEDGSKLTDIDPFSVIGIFNRGIKDNTRINLVNTFKDLFSIKSVAPNVFIGIPTLDNQKSIFFGFKQDREQNDINNLWSLFEQAIKSPYDIEEIFNIVRKQYIIKINITMGLYWIRPDSFIALDKCNRDYLKVYGIPVKYEIPKFSDYKKLIDNVKGQMTNGIIREKSFQEFSFNAYMRKINNNYKQTDETTENMITEDNTIKEESKYVKLLRANHNVIFSGSPGTGKTFLAKQIAEEMKAETCFVQFHPSYDYTDFVEGLRPKNGDDNNIGFERKDGVFKAFCWKALENLSESEKGIEKLQQEKSLQEKIDDFLDDAINSNVEYKTVSGSKFIITGYDKNIISIHIPANDVSSKLKIRRNELYSLLENNEDLKIVKDIKTFYKRNFPTQQDSYTFTLFKKIRSLKHTASTQIVSRVERKDFVFIIDEINRGEISKIFGELFFSIEPDYRGKAGLVNTQYQNLIEYGEPFDEGFFIPENVYIIGTMNDIDRNVESMDFAMRRRFVWQEITAEESARNMNITGELLNRMTRLNKVIAETEGLGTSFQIGGALFLKVKKGEMTAEELWKLNLCGLLKEYLRGFSNANEKLENMKMAYFDTETIGETTNNGENN